jgi:uncharacterized protein (TIGR02996 family)
MAGKKAKPLSSDLLGLLRDCKRNLDDNTSRMILADWLEDHGEQDRANLIREQCSVKHRDALHGQSFIDEVFGPAWICREDGDWIRGLCCAELDWLRRRQDVKDLKDSGVLDWIGYLKVLRLSTKQVAKFMSWLAKSELADVSCLEILQSWLGDEGVKDLAASPHLANIAALNLALSRIRPEGATRLAESPYAGKLEFLVLAVNEIGDEGMIALARSKFMTNLVAVDLRQNRIGYEGARALLESENLRDIKSLNLQRNDINPQMQAELRRVFGERVCL